MRRLSWGLCACVAVLLAVAPGAVAAPAPDPTCDFPAQATVRQRVERATVCEHTSGAQGMEPMLAVNRRGTLFMGIATDKGLYEDPGQAHRDRPERLLRSRDDGRTWDRIPLPGGIDASEGFPVHRSRDGPPVRHVVLGRRHALRPAGHPQRRRGRDLDRRRGAPGMLAARPQGDWPKIFSGPFKGKAPGALPDRRLRLQLHPEHPRRRVDRLLAIR